MSSNSTYVISLPAIQRTLKVLLSLQTHRNLPGYLCLLHTANTQKRTSDLQPDFKAFFERYFRIGSGNPQKPYLVPFHGKGDPKSLLLNVNVAGSYAPSSIRPVSPLRQLFDIDGPKSYSLKDNHLIAAKAVLLEDGVIPIGALACFLYRDFCFSSQEHPSIDMVLKQFYEDFGFALKDNENSFFSDDSAEFERGDFIAVNSKQASVNIRSLTVTELGVSEEPANEPNENFMPSSKDFDDLGDGQELADLNKKSGVEAEVEYGFAEPFDPSAISIEPKVVPMDTLLRRLRQGSIRLAPNFQRKFVWGIEKSSQLIESLMLRIPLPMFYVSANEDGSWDVVDGLQRLTTIRDYILGGDDAVPNAEAFALKGLEFWGESFDNKMFTEIRNDPKHARIVNHIMETELRFTVINPGTPEEVKRNIFKRINTGGMPLTSQEIRHALYQGKSTDLLETLSKLPVFRRAIDHRVDDTRMAARELILRFLAFLIRRPEAYTGDMDKFLSNTMRMINGAPKLSTNDLNKIFRNERVPSIEIIDICDLTEKFELAMIRAYTLFETYAFRKSLPGQHRTPVNKALFEAWATLLAEMPEDHFEQLLDEKETFFREYKILLSQPEFERDISREASSLRGVSERYKKLRALIGG